MKLSEIKNIIEESYNQDYNRHFIVVINGKKTKRKLFVSTNDLICQYAKGSRKKGYICNDTELWSEIYPTPKEDKTKMMYKRLSKVHSYLNRSGLWNKFKVDIEFLLCLDNKQMSKLVEGSYSEYCRFKEQNNLHISGDMFFNLLTKKGLKTINYDKYDREIVISNFAKAIKERTEYSRKWINGYDNSIHCKPIDNDMYAWYSEEYRGCANGHYYIALDERHVWFCEDD